MEPLWYTTGGAIDVFWNYQIVQKSRATMGALQFHGLHDRCNNTPTND